LQITESDFVITARLPIEVGTEINLDKVLLVGSASWTAIGTPLVGGGAQVTAIVYDHHRGHKLQVFKKRRRKGYTRKLGACLVWIRIRVRVLVSYSTGSPALHLA
jgi:large subunit ribosomal protein L21